MQLKILHIINDLGLGGAETLLYHLASRDRENDHIIVSLLGPAWYSSRLQDLGIELHHLHMDSPAAVPKGMLALNRIIRQSGADVVHCWMYRSNLVGGLVARKVGQPVVWAIHCSSLDPLTARSRALARLAGFVARWIPDFVINCSTRSAELHRELGYSAAPGAVVHNGYDPAIWFADDSARGVARSALGADRSDFIVGSVARWHAQKDIPNLLAALRIAHDRGATLRAYLVGVGLDGRNPELSEEIHRHGCENFVIPLGPRSDMSDLARALDLHVLASCGAEAFPNVVAETMLSGTPNIVTDVGDAALIVGESGWVAPPRDPNGLADAIIDAFREWKGAPARWARRRTAASRRIADNFSFDRMAGEYETIWRKVAGNK